MDGWLFACEGFAKTFTALFPIMNPIGCALLFPHVTKDYSSGARQEAVRGVARGVIGTLLLAIWAGQPLMDWLGIGVAALRVSGGLMVVAQAWRMVNGYPNEADIRPETIPGSYIPLTMPFTIGPGSLATVISLQTGDAFSSNAFWFALGSSIGVLCLAACVAVLYSIAGPLTHRLGKTRAAAATQIAAFLLMCVGVQILIVGFREVWKQV